MKKIAIPAALAVAILVALAGYSIANGGSSDDPARDRENSRVVEHKVEDPEDTESYWTEERMRDAEPAPMPTTPSVKIEE